ncbi:hypothetical protein H8356DRAFT_1308180 [Neocallimastix lanati (nom. inval.)]|nr:hypothetical protein H8356DRAFT_1308180 [Neocallimastix sp. JGI-2020a]
MNNKITLHDLTRIYDICVESDYEYSNDYIEILNKNGNITKHNCNTCIPMKKLKLINVNMLVVKMIMNVCRINVLTNIVGSYMHCGKPYGDSCKTNDECSSKECESNTCWIRTGGPSNPESKYNIEI